MKRLAYLVAATLAIGTGAGFAATLGVASAHLWAGSQTLVKGSCTVAASLDTYVDSKNPTSSFGAAATLLVQPDASQVLQTLVTFDLSSCNLPSTAGADSATLQLRVTTAPKNSRTLTLTRVTSAWSGTTTWNTAPTVAAGATTTFATGTANNATVSVPVTADVDRFVKGTVSNLGWRISDGGTAAAQDTTTFAAAPTLVVNYAK